MKYNCKVGFADGTISTLNVDIGSLDDFRQNLLNKDIFLIEATPEVFKFSFSFLTDIMFKMGRTKRIIAFTKLFSTLLKAGINIDEALLLLAEDEKEEKLKTIITAVRNEVLSGSSLASALSKQSDLFETIYSRSVMAGERSGNLPAVLDRLLFFYTKRYELKKKVMMALIYPAVLGFVAILAIIGLVTILVPKFTEAFANMNIELPAYTKFVISMSDFLTVYGPFLILLGGAIYYLFSEYLKTKKGRRNFDSFKLKIPVLGTIIGYSALSNFLLTLSTMIKGGIPVLESLVITEKAMGNVVYSEKIHQVIESVEKGESFNKSLRISGLFPDILMKMVKIGEESGELDAMLEEAALYFDDEVDVRATTLASLLEPIIMLGLAGVFLGIMLSIILPVFTAGSQIQ